MHFAVALLTLIYRHGYKKYAPNFFLSYVHNFAKY